MAQILPTVSAGSGAERVFAAAKPALVQIRTLVREGGRQSSIGSGFLVSADGLAITNYHVVSQFALEPQSYLLEYLNANGEQGELSLLAIDIAADLAVVKLAVEDAAPRYLEFDPAALRGEVAKGERLYSIGNPLDLGFTIVEGVHNGLVEKSYVERVHFSGAINPGMSGGPALTESGRVAGINVAKLLSGELVSFLVPARYAEKLLTEAQGKAELSLPQVRAEISNQLLAWQERLYQQLLADQSPRSVQFGDYRVEESELPWFSCWASTNSDERPKPKVRVQSNRCTMQNGVFVAGDLDTGLVETSYAYARTSELNDWQFAQFLSRIYSPGNQRYYDGERLTATQCHDSFVRGEQPGQPPLRALICAQAYKEFEQLYEVEVAAVTQDQNHQALVAKLSMRGVSYPNAMAAAQRFLHGIRWAEQP
ncbi:S1 family peptidase [Pseudomarimonas arenosa]|uniref:Trypsin-like peptidase domain-containing protein n=1 Tax=Pseudomarimonas arenosa TaxID=2774145 RepID=A0AAW3ZRE1_9GAMM|nr:serine protease [Pseudomarimonas arenosa]MBD8527174.1 trypsin-like peptidase domain-containing protein [Pseudomarimonas arenosa]